MPTQQTRNKKILVGLVPPWEYVEPVWELRVGEYRVFGIVLDFDENNQALGIEIEEASKLVNLSSLEVSALPLTSLVFNKTTPVTA